jgi:protein gp37
MAHRFGKSFEPTLHPEKLLEPLSLKKPSRIGVCFTGDLFGEWVSPTTMCATKESPYGKDLKTKVFDVIKDCHRHQFFFLTKNPDGYQKWGIFPDNAYCGVTVCDDVALTEAYKPMIDVRSKHAWLSIEPLTNWGMSKDDLVFSLKGMGINWVAIGGWSSGKNPPRYEWIKEIVDACYKAKVPVFLKNNLTTLLRENTHNIYSFPEWAGKQFAITGDHSLTSPEPHSNEPMRNLRQEFPSVQ